MYFSKTLTYPRKSISTFTTKRHCSSQLDEPLFHYNKLNYSELLKIRQKRFGDCLEQFKQGYEAPILKAFDEVRRLRKAEGNKLASHILTKNIPNIKYRNEERKHIQDQADALEVISEKILHDYAVHPPMHGEFFHGRTKTQKVTRNKFISTLLETRGRRRAKLFPRTFSPPPPSYLGSQDPNGWRYEAKLSEPELMILVRKDMENEGIDVDPGNRYDFRKLLEDRNRDLDEPFLRTVKQITQSVSKPNTVPDHPGILLPTPKKLKIKYPRIMKASDQHPIVFETVHFKDLHYNPYNTRKVILYVKVKALDLPNIVRNRLIAITQAKEIYDYRKDLLIIRSSKKRTMKENRQNVVRLFRTLLSEAWKADLNYLPQPDRYQPHEIIDKEVREEAFTKEQERLNNFDSIKEIQHFTLFRLFQADVPSPNIIQKYKSLAEGRLKFKLKQLETLIN